MVEDIQVFVNYYARMGYAKHIQELCLWHLQKNHMDPMLLFWHAFGLLLEGSLIAALKELHALIDQKEVEIAVIVAMVHSQQLCVMMDKEEVKNLEQRLEVAQKCGSEKALLLAATIFLHLGGKNNVKKSMDLIEKILKVQPHYVSAQCLNGWQHLIFHKNFTKVIKNHGENHTLFSERMGSALRIFDEVLAKENCVEALLGRAYYYEHIQEVGKALDDLNQVIVSHGWFIPALCEKASLALLLKDWILLQETTQLILDKDPNNLDGLRLRIQLMLCTENNMTKVANLLEDLCSCIKQKEPQNANLFLRVASPLARIAGRGMIVVLQKTLALMEIAHGLNPECATFIVEMAHQQFLLADYKAALLNYRRASQMDELSMEAMYGAIQCLIIIGKLEEAEQQLEFLVEINFSNEESPSLCYLLAQLAWEKNRDFSRCEELLVKMVHYYKKVATRKTHDYNIFVELNPDQLIAAVHLFSILSHFEYKGFHMDKSGCLQRGMWVLELVLSWIPGLLIGHLMLAEILIQLEEFDSAHCTLQTALSLDETCAIAHILLTQIYVQNKKFELAKQSLEQALCDNFTVRESIKYHVLHAQILLQSNQDETALKVLESTMYLSGMQNCSEDSYISYYFTPQSKMIGRTSDNERVLVYLLQANVHIRLDHIPEASKILQDAMHRFKGTPQEVQITIANCELALGRGDVNAALTLLQQVPCDSSYYIQARVTIADIYMTHQQDKVHYIACYLEIVKLFPNSKTYMLLGDALMKVDELERAMKAYDAAMKESPKDALIASQVGKVLATTHNYAKAIDHYKTVLQNIEEGPHKLVLHHDLADLYFKLKNYEQAEAILNDMLANADVNIKDKYMKHITGLLMCLKGSLLLSKVQQLLGKHGTLAEEGCLLSTASKYLHHYKIMFTAKSIQNRMLPIGKHHGMHEDAFREQRNVAADIYFQFAQECETQKDLERAVILLNEALNCNPQHNLATIAIAKIHLSRGDIIECEQKCADVLRIDPFNLDAGNILVHLMLYKEMYESAIVHFKQNLERDPYHYISLAQLIKLLQRAGQLDEAQQYVLKIENVLPRPHTHAGLYFCKGLVAHYSNNRFETLQLLNQARVDSKWGIPSIYLMIEVYLNIDNELIWEEANQDGNMLGNEEGIKAAWKLLGESRLLDGKYVKQLVLECYATMATRQKADIEFSLGRLNEALAREEHKVPILLAIAIAWILLKQNAKAKIQLRVIDRCVYKWDDGEDFERAWLMLASILMQSGKHNAVEELCRKCLKYNKDCGRALVYLGQILEIGHSFTEAISYFENAWKCQKEASPSIGYRLAFIYLKEKRYTESISICHKVLKSFNNYPQIKKDILDKARLCVRV